MQVSVLWIYPVLAFTQKITDIFSLCGVYFSGFAVEQGFTESAVGIFRGVGAIFGVLGTLIYPLMRQKLGLKVTGVLTFLTDVIFLTPCIASIFVAGSPFEYDYYFKKAENFDDVTEVRNAVFSRTSTPVKTSIPYSLV